MNETRKELKRVRPADEVADFVMSWVDHSREESRDDMEEIWDEVEQNFLVRPYADRGAASDTAHPLLSSFERRGNLRGASVLKDPETHQEIMTIVSKIVLALFPDSEFINAKPVGFEDAHRSMAATKLLHYIHRLPCHYQTFTEWVFQIAIYGTGLFESSWEYREEAREMRRVDVDPLTGLSFSDTQLLMVPVYDDVKMRTVDLRDFFPDPASVSCADMPAAAKRFRVTAAAALQRAEDGIYDRAAVDRALENRAAQDLDERDDKPYDDASQLNPAKETLGDFKVLTGYEYYGEVPFGTEDGVPKRVITVLHGETVRSAPWPRRIPFFDGRITPRLGSFWGIGTGEIVRCDQDFADTLKMMLADAVVRMTHPPHIVNRSAGVDIAALRRFAPKVPIMADTVDAVQQVDYRPPVDAAFAMYSGVKQQMREASGALGAIQGLGIGTKRLSATEAGSTFNQALDRPEMFAAILEKEYLPHPARFNLELYQTFMEEGTDDLARRIGESNAAVDVSDILVDFDIEFVGSRHEGSRQERLQSAREIFAASSNPIVAQMIPWIPFLRKFFADLGQHEIAAMVGNPQLVQFHMMLTQMLAPGAQQGNGNGEQQQAAGPPAQDPAQALGGTQVA